RGESYRFKDRRRAGLLPRSEQEAPSSLAPALPSDSAASKTRRPQAARFGRSGVRWQRQIQEKAMISNPGSTRDRTSSINEPREEISVQTILKPGVGNFQPELWGNFIRH